MLVHVKLFATLRRYRPGLKIGEAFPVKLPADATVEQLARHLDLPRSEVKVIFVNGVVRGPDHVLAEEDELCIFPSVGGG